SSNRRTPTITTGSSPPEMNRIDKDTKGVGQNIAIKTAIVTTNAQKKRQDKAKLVCLETSLWTLTRKVSTAFCKDVISATDLAIVTSNLRGSGLNCTVSSIGE